MSEVRVIPLDKVLVASECVLQSGRHHTRFDGMCATELTAYLAGEEHSDHPACASPVWADAVRRINDLLPETERQGLKELSVLLVDSSKGDDTEDLRSLMVVDYAVRYILLDLLKLLAEDDASAKLPKDASWSRVPLHCLPALRSWSDLTKLRPWVKALCKKALELRAGGYEVDPLTRRVFKGMVTKMVDGIRTDDTIVIPHDTVISRGAPSHLGMFSKIMETIEEIGLQNSYMAIGLDTWQLGVCQAISDLAWAASDKLTQEEWHNKYLQILADLRTIVTYNLKTKRFDYDHAWQEGTVEHYAAQSFQGHDPDLQRMIALTDEMVAKAMYNPAGTTLPDGVTEEDLASTFSLEAILEEESQSTKTYLNTYDLESGSIRTEFV